MGLIEEKRERIVEAALAEFQELGFAGANMDRVAGRAGVSKRTVYNHFAGKEALFRAILDMMAETCCAALVVTYVPGQPIRAQLVEAAWVEGRLITSPSFLKLARIVLAETMRDPALAAAMSARMEPLASFRAFLAAAAADGALAIDDPQLAADQFVGLIKAQGFWPAVFSGVPVSQETMATIVETTVETIMARYAPQGRC
ncbi:MAG: TetR/AcrR family transcriptional regulator [Pseudomonadota bacterium]